MNDTTMKPGDGASYCIGGDAYPMTIRKVSASGKTVWASSDDFLADGTTPPYTEGDISGTFTSRFEDNPGQWEKFTMRKNGAFRPATSSCGCLVRGRSFRRNPHF